MKKLDENQISIVLQDRLKTWKHSGEALEKQYSFKDFKMAMKFVNQVADLAESMDHHPDIKIEYSNVTLTLSTHSEGGITSKDVELAEKIEKL